MKPRASTWGATALLLGVSALLAYPFVWMVFAGFKSNREIMEPLQVLPHAFSLEYYQRLFANEWLDFGRVFLNSFLVAGLQALLAVVVTAMAGFVFARYSFRGKGLLAVAALLTILIPRQVIALPLYSWLIDLKLYDSLWGVILPGAVTGVGVLFFMQVFRQFPESLLEAGRMEGASEFRLFWMVLPLAGSALLTYGLIHFVLAWHEHLIPLLVLQQPENQTLPVAMSSLYGSGLRYPKAVIMAASTMTIVPNVILFGLMYRRAQSALSEMVAD